MVVRRSVRESPETVHWVAHRPATTETFEAVVAPRRRLAPKTPQHVELESERLRAGGTLQAWHRASSEFTRPDDVLVVWGTFHRDLAAAAGRGGRRLDALVGALEVLLVANPA